MRGQVKRDRSMDSPEEIKSALRDLFAAQRLAVLATHDDDGQPYASLMAFAATDDLRFLLIATGRPTRKYANLKQHPTVSLLVHNSANMATDIRHAMAVTVSGRASEVPVQHLETARSVYLAKQPHMKAFATSPNTAIIEVSVDRYDVVAHFQDVTILEIRTDRIVGS